MRGVGFAIASRDGRLSYFSNMPTVEAAAQEMAEEYGYPDYPTLMAAMGYVPMRDMVVHPVKGRRDIESGKLTTVDEYLEERDEEERKQ